jgi:hypothetical protein
MVVFQVCQLKGALLGGFVYLVKRFAYQHGLDGIILLRKNWVMRFLGIKKGGELYIHRPIAVKQDWLGNFPVICVNHVLIRSGRTLLVLPGALRTAAPLLRAGL